MQSDLDRRAKNALIAAGLFFWLCLGAALISYHAGVLLKLPVSFIAYGRSFFQMYFCFAFLGAGLLLSAFSPLKKAAPIPPIRMQLVLLVLVALNTASYLIYCGAVGVAPEDRTIVYGADNLSSTRLSHIHTMKPVLVEFARWFGLSQHLHRGDNGLAYIGILPAYLPTCGAVLLLIAAGFFFYELCSRRLADPVDFIWHAVLKTFACFIVLKDFVDGGFFSADAIVAISILWVLTRSAAPEDREGILTRIVLYSLVLGSLCAAFLTFDGALLGPLLQVLWTWLLEIILALLIIFAVALLLQAAVERRPPVLIKFLIVLIGLIWGIRASPWLRFDSLYLFSPLRRGDVVHFMIPKEDLTPGARADTPEYALLRQKITSDTTALGWYEKYHFRPGINYLAVEKRNCALDHIVSASAEIKILAGSLDVSSIHSEPLSEIEFVPCKRGEWCTVRAYIRVAPCVPITIAMLPEPLGAIARAGATHFVCRNEAIWNLYH